MIVPNIIMHVGHSEGFRAFMSRYEPTTRGGVPRNQLYNEFRKFVQSCGYEIPRASVPKNQFYEAVRLIGIKEDAQGTFRIKRGVVKMENNIVWRDCSKTRTAGGKRAPNYDVSLSVINRKNKEKEIVGKSLNIYFRNKGLEVAKKYKYLIISDITANRIYFDFLPDDEAFARQGRSLSFTNKNDKNPSITTSFPLLDSENMAAMGWVGEYELRLNTSLKFYYIEKTR